MKAEGAAPAKRYAMAFVDGQNLFRHAKDAFGHFHPNYDLVKLHRAICEANGWIPTLVRFYTGIPKEADDPLWGPYWAKRILAMKRAGIVTTTRPIRYRDVNAVDEKGDQYVERIAQEKGIDVRLALDIVSLARKGQYGVGVIYSQDQDLNEIVAEVQDIAKEQGRSIELVSAFPSGPRASYGRGIDRTTWVRIEQAVYDACLDPYDYRVKTSNS